MGENQKDLVLSNNEYAYILDQTKGNVGCWVGPCKTSLSNSDMLVQFDETKKKFVPANHSEAVKIYTTAPENWYVILKNPASDNKHPTPGMINNLPETMSIGCKVNIEGPVSFALYPGQMAKIIQGHSLRSNQYLLAKVYDADSANRTKSTALDTDGAPVEISNNYVTGQLIIIKGTEVSFYIPPTGIEVVVVDKRTYVRDAITLERLEYCILKDEDGNKRYVHGPEVVFPKPTESFVTAPAGGCIFKAIELSPISGIYVKVIAEYEDERITRKVGEELFITGKDQMIYYPRPEHAIIDYNGKIVHHAIAIPKGEGRYVLNRLNGNITTIYGPDMYLPDPRYEVVVSRKLTKSQCDLWFPGNQEVLMKNGYLQTLSDFSTKSIVDSVSCNTSQAIDFIDTGFNRSTTYSPVRTVTLDTKFDGVVALDIWTGYAVNTISKTGARKVISGPQTILLDYDQTLEVLELSTGKPKTTDNLLRTVYLRHENNKISDIIDIETSDFCSARVKVSYCVNFSPSHKDKWFSVDNYVKYLCDRVRSELKRTIKLYDIQTLYSDYSNIIRDIILDNLNSGDVSEDGAKDSHLGRFFPENGMYIHDVEILTFKIDENMAYLFSDFEDRQIRQRFELEDAKNRLLTADQLAIVQKKEYEVKFELIQQKANLDNAAKLAELTNEQYVNDKKNLMKLASAEAEKDMQPLLDTISEAERNRTDAEAALRAKIAQGDAELEKAKQQAYAEMIEKIMASITPDLVAALESKSNSQMLETVTNAMSPYSIAMGMPIADTVNTLLRGTSLEGVIDKVINNN